MDLKNEKKQIYIDKEAFAILEMIEGGILSPVSSLMSEEETAEVNQTGLFKGVSFPSPLVFAPNGKKNQAIIQDLQKGEEVDLYLQDQKVGSLEVEDVFPINREEKVKKIVGGDWGHPEAQRILQRIGHFAICGKMHILGQSVEQNKQRIQEAIKRLNAKKICGIMLNANPIHKVHEKTLQEALLKNDLLIVFIPHHNDWFLPFHLRIKCLEFVINNFLVPQKILVIPLTYTYFLAGQNRMILNALICKNYGCTDFIASLGSSDLSTFFEGDHTRTIMDGIQGIDLSIHLLSEYIYCNVCNTIKSTKICPHGKHHHISYDSKNFFEMLKLGLMPPEVFMRKEVSAMIMTYLFPNKAKKLNKLYSDLMSKDGIMELNEEKFYENLSRLYHVK